MSQLFAVAGSKIFIGSATTSKSEVTTADFDQADFVEVDGWTNAGELGDSQEVISQALINRKRMAKVKGILDGGTMDNQFVPIADDSGQLAMREASKSNALYQFKIEWSDGEVNMFNALVLPSRRSGGEANTAHYLSWQLAVDSNLTEE